VQAGTVNHDPTMKTRWRIFNNRRTPISAPQPPPADPARPATLGPASNPAAADSALPEDFWRIDEAAALRLSERTFYQVSLDVFFNARHAVTFQGRAGPEHAHSYRLQATCRVQGLAREDPVVVGYEFLRQKMTRVVSAYNNQLLNALPPFQTLQPTTEILAAVLFRQLDRLLLELGLVLTSITIWESPTEAITYSRDC
jgi:6-pyruvoyl-tetrahydropterin synthase